MPENNSVIFNILPSQKQGGMEQVFLDYSATLKRNNLNIIAIVPKKFKYFTTLKEL